MPALTPGTATLSASIEAVGVLGPGLTSWAAAAAILRGAADYEPSPTVLPPPQALPPAERRRAGRVVRLSLAVAEQAVRTAGAAVHELSSVFSSSGADGDNCHEILQTLAGPERLLSPTRFHNSVHNAPAAYWSIAHACMRPSTALCGYDASFAAALLESLTQLSQRRGPLLLVAYDLDYPPPMRAVRPIPDALGIALLLHPLEASGCGPRIQVQLTAAAASAMTHPALERLRRAIPAARGLPLLEALAQRLAGRVVLDYLDGLQLAVAVQPREPGTDASTESSP